MQELVGTIEKNAKEQVRIELTEFKGYDLVGVRVYAQTESGYTPTKKGITVSVKILPELVEALKKAQAAAVKAGLIDKG